MEPRQVIDHRLDASIRTVLWTESPRSLHDRPVFLVAQRSSSVRRQLRLSGSFWNAEGVECWLSRVFPWISRGQQAFLQDPCWLRIKTWTPRTHKPLRYMIYYFQNVFEKASEGQRKFDCYGAGTVHSIVVETYCKFDLCDEAVTTNHDWLS